MPSTLEHTTLTVGDTTPGLTGSVAANITGATLEAHVKRPDGTVLTRPLVIVDGPTGGWSLPAWTDGDLNEEGWYELEVEVTFAGGEKQTFWADPEDRTPVVFYARAQLA